MSIAFVKYVKSVANLIEYNDVKPLHWQNMVSCTGLKGDVVLLVDNSGNSGGTGKGTLTGVNGIGDKQ